MLKKNPRWGAKICRVQRVNVFSHPIALQQWAGKLMDHLHNCNNLPEDLNKIISYGNQMAAFVPYAHSDRGGWLSNTGWVTTRCLSVLCIYLQLMLWPCKLICKTQSQWKDIEYLHSPGNNTYHVCGGEGFDGLWVWVISPIVLQGWELNTPTRRHCGSQQRGRGNWAPHLNSSCTNSPVTN